MKIQTRIPKELELDVRAEHIMYIHKMLTKAEAKETLSSNFEESAKAPSDGGKQFHDIRIDKRDG